MAGMDWKDWGLTWRCRALSNAEHKIEGYRNGHQTNVLGWRRKDGDCWAWTWRWVTLGTKKRCPWWRHELTLHASDKVIPFPPWQFFFPDHQLFWAFSSHQHQHLHTLHIRLYRRTCQSSLPKIKFELIVGPDPEPPRLWLIRLQPPGLMLYAARRQLDPQRLKEWIWLLEVEIALETSLELRLRHVSISSQVDIAIPMLYLHFFHASLELYIPGLLPLLRSEMMNNITLYPAHSDAQVANAANAYEHSNQIYRS